MKHYVISFLLLLTIVATGYSKQTKQVVNFPGIEKVLFLHNP